MIAWVIGANGLIGNAISRRCQEIPSGTMFTPTPIPWGDPMRAQSDLMSHTMSFTKAAGAGDWAIIWAAGSATVSSSIASAAPELAALNAVVNTLRSSPPAGRGIFFLTSSAGGVYSGSTGAPFTHETPVRPLSPYGEIKVQQEQSAQSALAGICTLVIGRLSNVYGPGQNLGKLQGLISRLALATATRQPINIFVSLDTLRDYIFVDDAAKEIVALMDSARKSTNSEMCHIRVVASGESVTLGQVIRTMELVTKRRVPVALGSHPSSASQVLDLRLLPSEPRFQCTSLPIGTKLVYHEILRRLQQPSDR